MKNNEIITSVILFVFFLSGCLNQKLSVEDGWANPGIEGENSAVYLVIDNSLQKPETLTSAETDVAEFVEFHLSKMDDSGMMSMEHQSSLRIDPRTRLLFQPGGLHIMLINLRRDLNQGETFNLVLNFEEADSIEIEVFVKEP